MWLLNHVIVYVYLMLHLNGHLEALLWGQMSSVNSRYFYSIHHEDIEIGKE